MLNWKNRNNSKRFGTADEDIFAYVTRGRKFPLWIWGIGWRSSNRTRDGRASTREEAMATCERLAADMRAGGSETKDLGQSKVIS